MTHSSGTHMCQVFLCAHVCKKMYMSMCTCVWLHMHMHVRTRVLVTRTHVRTHNHTHTHTHVLSRSHTRAHAHTHTPTHAHTHRHAIWSHRQNGRLLFLQQQSVTPRLSACPGRRRCRDRTHLGCARIQLILWW
jgi:hypothetical protein